VLITLIFGRIEIGLDLCVERLGEHPPRSLAGDLAEVEHEHLLTRWLILVYPEHLGVSFPPALARRNS
jgi:hypothetical protein